MSRARSWVGIIDLSIPVSGDVVVDGFAELLSQAKQGNAQAVEALLVPHLPGLTAFVRLKSGRALRRRESCSDLVQSVCRQVIGNLQSLRAEDEDAFRHWLYAAARNKILQKHDYHSAQKRDMDREAQVHTVGDGDLLDCYAELCTPSRDAMAREEIARIEAAFDQLSPDYREVLILARITGLSTAAIAEQLNKTEPAVRKLLSRARARLAMLLA